MSSSIANEILSPIENVDTSMNGLNLGDSNVMMASSIPSSEETIANARLAIQKFREETKALASQALFIEANSNAMQQDLDSLPGLNELIKLLNSKVERMESHLLNCTEDTIPVGPKAANNTNTERKLANNVHGSNFPDVCACLLSLAIIEDTEQQCVETALEAIPAADLTWEVCKQTFI
ncbi:hypothetical protein BGZ76_003032 [Entomortierella beljakovae]|nr:hypothetical protein BGZ76_003032 [Entomortierella beljakovae]